MVRVEAAPPAISVIIPTLDEAESLSTCLASIRAIEGGFEIIVADGGSQDGTLEVARAAGVRVVSAPRGRGAQMNAGAEVAQGSVVLFLHADVRLPEDGLAQVLRALGPDRVVGGSFRLRFDRSHLLLSLYGAITKLPFGWARYGDQGLFLRRADFDRLGGYRELPIMEDVDLFARLGRLGRTVVLPATVTASARRFERRGIVKQQLRNTWLVMLYRLGVSPERLASSYYEPS